MTMGWLPSLDIDLLRSFTLIAEGGSFTRAAERVGRTQSAVSLQVQRLESLVGHRLFVRGRGGLVQLTPQGRYLLERAREMVSLNDDIVGSLRAQPQRAVTGPVEAGPQTPQLQLAGDGSHGKPSVAILPFQNMSGDPQQDYFADGMFADIVTGLSRS